MEAWNNFETGRSFIYLEWELHIPSYFGIPGVGLLELTTMAAMKSKFRAESIWLKIGIALCNEQFNQNKER